MRIQKNILSLLFIFMIAGKGVSASGLEKDSLKRKPTYLAFPVVAYSPETRLKYGLAGLYSFYPKNSDSNTRVSNVLFGVFFTQNKQSIINPYANLWTNKNKYHFVVDPMYSYYPENFYGIGNHTTKANEDKINVQKGKLFLEAERTISDNFYSGPSFLFQKDKITDILPSGIYSSENTLIAPNGATIVHLGWSTIYDNRDFNTYSTKGNFLKFNFSGGLKDFGSDYSLFEFELQTRNFLSLNPKTSIGFNTLLKSIQGNQIPFNILNQMGGENLMRGYITGRFREQNLLVSQMELRYRPFNYFAFVGFIGTGQVFKNSDFAFNEFKINYGIGARVFMDLRSRLTLRFDYGFGEKPMKESRIQNFYISVSEAF